MSFLNKLRFNIFLLFFLVRASLFAQSSGEVILEWESPKSMTVLNEEQKVMSFVGAFYRFEQHNSPLFLKKIRLPKNTDNVHVDVEVTERIPLTNEEKLLFGEVSSGSVLTWRISTERKVPYLIVSYLPIDGLGKITRFNYSINLTYKDVDVMHRKAVVNSVLSEGDWYKIRVVDDGLYKLDSDFLSSMGLEVSNLDPRNIQVYGNGGAMLPELNSVLRHSDLVENAIYVNGEEDGSFDKNDFVVFYGESPHRWSLDEEKNFKHKLNIYDSHNYYFIRVAQNKGKRVNLLDSPEAENHEVDFYTDRKFHELERKNLKNTGRQWFGEYFAFNEQYSINFNFQNRIKTEPLLVNARAVGRSEVSTSLLVKHRGSQVLKVPIGTQVSASTYVDDGEGMANFYSSVSPVDVDVSYDKSGNSSAFAYLDYIELQAKCKLKYDGGQLLFSEPSSVGDGNVTKFNLAAGGRSFVAWDVTDPVNTSQLRVAEDGSFLSSTEELKSFVIHDLNSSSYKTPVFDHKVPNQNLHGQESADLLIITAPEFIQSAERLAQLHIKEDGIKVQVATTDEIYNEFSSGKQDLVALRSYIRMMYIKTDFDQMPDNVLLFGDASFDYKGIGVSQNEYTQQNFVPTFQSEYSFKLGPSYCTDDFLTYLDDDEGGLSSMQRDGMDVGIGRLVVQTPSEADAMVDKIEAYYSENAHGDWRGNICFVADDIDETWERSLQENMDKIAEHVDTSYHNYNISKIYLDAYQQVSSSGGERYPEARQAIVDRVNKGALIVHYYGHGGEVGWAEERVLQMSDINAWENKYNLPVFVTATCEFARYDDAKRVSAGERVLLNPEGAGIALFTTTRTITESDAKNLSEAFYKYALPEQSGEALTFGQVMKGLKNDLVANGVSGTNKMKFTLLGDPALRLPIPQYQVVVTEILNGATNVRIDSLHALTHVKLKGEIQNSDGLREDAFHGVLTPKIYDKPQRLQTLRNDQEDLDPFYFELQQNLLYSGKVSVENGRFEFEFMVPQDISFSEGSGKFSLYASNENSEAIGAFVDIPISGFEEGYELDDEGPSIELYMNNSDFRYGGITDASPSLYALITDASGINTTGNGIGHDLVATMNEDDATSVVLNSYYEADMDSYQSGHVKYPYTDLEEGLHQLKLKVWDVHNNSSEAFTEFVVVKHSDLILQNLMNYPNPFSDFTRIHFEHNRPDEVLEVRMEIYDLKGVKLRQEELQISNSSYANSDFTWDGTSNEGAQVNSGMYVCRVIVTSENSVDEVVISNQMILIK